MTLGLYGLGVSRGIAIGKVYTLSQDELNVAELRINESDLESEVARFEHALAYARHQLNEVRDQIPDHTPVEIKSFIDTHLLMLEDAALAEVPIDIIRIRKCNAEWALKLQRDALVSVFEEMDDAYLRTRQDDVDYVVNRIQRILKNQGEQPPDLSSSALNGVVIVADDLSPADTVVMQNQGVAAFVTEYGGTTSHTAILARSLGIPAIVGVHNARRYLKRDEVVVVDGRQGLLLADADKRLLEYFRARRQEESARADALRALKGQPAITLDQQKIDLCANVELPEDLLVLRRVAAEGVGLYRTELLFLNRDAPPSEEEQLEAYSQVIAALDGAPVTIRTLDLGADKTAGWQHAQAINMINPALSLRGVRWCLREPEIFKTQLRAILRASRQGQVRLMIPLLSQLQELLQVLHIIDEVKGELRKQGLAFDAKLPVGGMIEVPAAALSADIFAKYLDFLSIGTNDLIQYTIAADRLDDAVNYLYDPLHPGVLRLIQMVIVAGQRAGIPVAMCGEMAGDVKYTRLLLGMGLREFSMHPAFLLEVKRCVTESDLGELISRVEKILPAADPRQIETLVEALNTES